ncbi:transporter substrate-binding domain-containing protein [Myxococcota bacterium]|nr:transporter substrate-binding domain-containing protein [Myxococcota bacterium]
MILALTSAAPPGIAGAQGARPPDLLVGTSGDYAPFSDERGGLHGFDVALARAWAKSMGRSPEFVSFRWPELLPDLADERFDVAMSGITVRPERSVAGRFSLPVAETGAVLLVPRSLGWRDPKRANQPGLRIAVNAGGHLQRVAEKHYPKATLVVIPDNQAVLETLVERKVDAAVSDSLEAPVWLAEAEGFEALGPFTLDRKAPLLRPELTALAGQLDRWLMAREADGTLARMRFQAFGKAAEPMGATAAPLEALFAAIDERLALMPAIAVAKQRAGLPFEVPAREVVVLATAAAAVERAVTQHGGWLPPPAAVQDFFQAQMEAAKQVQRTTLRSPSGTPAGPAADLEDELRPALLRIGDRIAGLIPRLPRDLAREDIEAAARRSLRSTPLSNESREILVQAIWRLSRSATLEGPSPQTHRLRFSETAKPG